MAHEVSGAAARFPFEAVIFDMDGVLIDSEWTYTREQLELSRAFGLGLTEEDVRALVGQSHKVFTSTVARWFERIGRRYTPAEALAVYREWARERPIDYRAIMMPGAREALSGLAERGVRLALASSSRLDDIRFAMEACGLLDFFEVVVSGEQFHESKPNPEIYLHTLELLGLPAGACCCVEDSIPGITAGKRAGLTVVARREERFGFTQDMADRIVDTLPELLELSAAR